MMSVMKRHIQNCPREGKSPERTRTELVTKRLRAWMELMRKSYAEWGSLKFILIPVNKVAGADKRAARFPQSLLGCPLMSQEQYTSSVVSLWVFISIY